MARRIIIKGNVQGVFCREYCKQNAKALGLNGAVSNLADGDVELLINSNNQALIIALINNLKKNPYRFRFNGEIISIQHEDYNRKDFYGNCRF